MSDSTSSKCTKQSGKLTKSQLPTIEQSDIKSCLRHMGRKNYLEQDEDTLSDYGLSLRKKSKSSTTNLSERKLSLRGPKPSTPSKVQTAKCTVIDLVSPKQKNMKRNTKSFSTSDRQLRNQTIVESVCCGKVDTNDISQSELSSLASNESKSRKSKARRLMNSNESHDSSTGTDLKISPKQKLQPSAISTLNRRTSMKVKPELSKPKVIDHFKQSEEINIESTSTNLPKKSSIELKKNNTLVTTTETISSRRRSTLSQKHSDNNLQKFNGGVSHTSRNSLSHHGKLCRKTKKTTIYHDSNDWIISKGYHSVCSEFWDWSHFNNNQDKSVKTQEEIEIPSFREKKYTPLYKIEGTEDLSDHVFEERHLPYEIMEKKIKKNYVMQSKYELQKSKYLKNNELLYKKETFLAKKFPKAVDLNQDPNNVKKIEISTEVPVMAFGVPIKQVELEEFCFIPGFGE